uniref:PDEase domain-containing protein n=1 Tax=Eutreptiella gymnastica TaxID=73025 RepID=A0A6U8N623_9EUGL
MLALMLAGLVRYLDHCGLNNSFHQRASSATGQLCCMTGSGLGSVSSTAAALHHCSSMLQLLNDPKCNVFGCLEPATQNVAINALCSLTLTTDWGLAGVQQDIDSAESIDRTSMMNMLMVTADLYVAMKPFDAAQEWAVLRTEEFHSKGDLAKEWYEQDDISDMSRLAKAQLDHMDNIVLPHLQRMVRIAPAVQDLLMAAKANRQKWDMLSTPHAEEVGGLLSPAPTKYRHHAPR